MAEVEEDATLVQINQKIGRPVCSGKLVNHLRSFNKAAYWLHTYAMDTRRSVVYVASEGFSEHPLRVPMEERLAGDIAQWIGDRRQSHRDHEATSEGGGC
ncbi:hypothetical protein Pcac1_g10825 [Phytophthora cactorum]|nr:hypothetical protein Pcac1_g10825 [Phytophthora cactorum]